MKVPEIYAEWIPVLDAFAKGDNDKEIVPLMKKGTIPASKSVLIRFSYRMNEALKERYELAIKRFSSTQSLNQSADSAESAVMNFISELKHLKQAVYIPALPAGIRNQFPHAVEEAAEKSWNSLLESAKNDRSGVLLHILKSHEFNGLGDVK